MKSKNIFAGTILAENIEEKNINFEFNLSTIDCNFWVNKLWDKKLYYFWGETIFDKSLDIYNHIAPFIFWKIYFRDISISTEDKIKTFENKQKQWKYVLEIIHGRSFEEVLEIYKDTSIISIREAEKSKIFDTPVIKIDFII